ncbi:MAG: pyroglutamyl-peptidase [Myxococcota bacterium]|jgi:pyroglutamyl-peptidase
MGAAHRILVTAFEGFTTREGLHISPNPTERLLDQLIKRRPELIPGVLPVSFLRTRERLEALLAEHQPTAWIGLGIAATRDCIDLEAVGLNIEHALGADNDGDSPTGRSIEPMGPPALFSSLRVVDVARELSQANLPVRVSYSAGTFLCNQALYVGCLHARRGALDVAAFVHIPLEGVSDPIILTALEGVLDRLPVPIHVRK